MTERKPGGDPSVAQTLRDLNNVAFMHRDRGRFRAGTSELLDLALEPAPGSGMIVDASSVPELRTIARAPGGALTIGAFATVGALREAAPEIAPEGASIAAVRLRLALHGAQVTVYGLGRRRTSAIGELELAPHEIPVSIACPAPPPGLGIAERRRATNDGAASFTLGVTAALRVGALRRFEHVRIFLDIDGAVRRASKGEAKLEGQRCEPEALPEAARAAAGSMVGSDARSSAIARALQPLVLACLRDALEAAGPR